MSIPLIAIHVNIESATGRNQSAAFKISTDINKHFSGVEVTDVLREEPVFLLCSLSEIT